MAVINSQLLRRPHPYSDESLAGYIIRLSESNHYANPHWIWQMANLHRSNVSANVFHPRKHDLSKLGQLADVTVEKLWSMTFTWTQRALIQVFGHAIPMVYFPEHRVKLCPICLQEAAYYRLIWDLTIVNVCPSHQCWLMDKCPQCQQMISWNRANITKCCCQFDWRDVTPVLAPNLGLSALVYQLCQIKSGFTKPILGSLHPASNLSFNQLVTLLSSLLKFCRLPYVNTKFFWPIRQQKAYPFNSDSYWELAFSLFNRWPDEFRQQIVGYRDFFQYYPRPCQLNRLQDLQFIAFFMEAIECFPEDDFGSVRAVFEECFWQFFSSRGMRKFQLCFRERKSLYIRRLPIHPIAGLVERFTQTEGLAGLTLAKLLAQSAVDFEPHTILFKKVYRC